MLLLLMVFDKINLKSMILENNKFKHGFYSQKRTQKPLSKLIYWDV